MVIERGWVGSLNIRNLSSFVLFSSGLRKLVAGRFWKGASFKRLVLEMRGCFKERKCPKERRLSVMQVRLQHQDFGSGRIHFSSRISLFQWLYWCHELVLHILAKMQIIGRAALSGVAVLEDTQLSATACWNPVSPWPRGLCFVSSHSGNFCCHSGWKKKRGEGHFRDYS